MTYYKVQWSNDGCFTDGMYTESESFVSKRKAEAYADKVSDALAEMGGKHWAVRVKAYDTKLVNLVGYGNYDAWFTYETNIEFAQAEAESRYI